MASVAKLSLDFSATDSSPSSLERLGNGVRPQHAGSLHSYRVVLCRLRGLHPMYWRCRTQTACVEEPLRSCPSTHQLFEQPLSKHAAVSTILCCKRRRGTTLQARQGPQERAYESLLGEAGRCLDFGGLRWLSTDCVEMAESCKVSTERREGAEGACDGARLKHDLTIHETRCPGQREEEESSRREQ